MSDMQKNENKAVEQSEKKEKSAAKKKEQKPGLFARIGRWFREMRSELKKVSWPSWKATLKNVGVVILCVLVVGVFIWVFDAIIHAVIQALLGLL